MVVKLRMQYCKEMFLGFRRFYSAYLLSKNSNSTLLYSLIVHFGEMFLRIGFIKIITISSYTLPLKVPILKIVQDKQKKVLTSDK